MSGIFALGLFIVLPLCIVFIWFAWSDHSGMDKVSRTLVSLVCVGITCLVLGYGYYKPSASLTKKYNNPDNLTWTIVEYSMSGGLDCVA